MQLEILGSYATQVRDVEQLEKEMKQEKQAFENRIRQWEEKQKKINADEDFLIKSKAEWSAQSTKRINDLESTLEQKRETIERLDRDYSAKIKELSKL